MFFSYLFLLFSFSFLSRLKSWLVYLFHIRCKKKNMIKKKEEKKSRKKNLWYTWVIKWLRKSCVYTRSTLFLLKCNTPYSSTLSLATLSFFSSSSSSSILWHKGVTHLCHLAITCCSPRFLLPILLSTVISFSLLILFARTSFA